jgi:hypothetical protein
MTQVITVTEMARSFSDIIARVYHKGEEFDIKKGANIVAHISAPKPANDRVVAFQSATEELEWQNNVKKDLQAIREKYAKKNDAAPKTITFGGLMDIYESTPRMSSEECDELESRIKQNRKDRNWRTGTPWN